MGQLMLDKSNKFIEFSKQNPSYCFLDFIKMLKGLL